MAATVLNKFRLLTAPVETICQRCVASMGSSAALPKFPTLKLDQLNAEISKANSENFSRHEEVFKSALAVAHAGGGAKAIERHTQRNKKMVVEDRVKALIDEDTPFLELSPLAGFMMEYGTVPRAGVITGIGSVCGKLCMVLANDGAFKGGTSYPITVRKQLRAQEIAQQNRIPCIYVVDSGGAFLPLQSDIFPDKNHGGRAFYNEAIMSAEQIPQVAVVCGSCTAGGAYVPTMAQETVIVHRTGSVFLGGPPLVKAALGEIISTEDLGGATVHCKVSGCTDYFAQDEKSAFETCRDIVSTLNVHHEDIKGRLPSRLPLYDPQDLPSLIPSNDQHQIDMFQVIARVVDASAFHEFKQMFGPSLITGFAHVDGYLVGIVGNQGEVTADAASKGAHFVTLCNERQIPLIFLQNTSPEIADKGNALQLKCQARMMAVVSCSTVPKITVVVGNAGGKAMSPNFVFSWPNAVRCAETPHTVMEAVEAGLRGSVEDEAKRESMIAKYKDRVAMETTAVFASSRVLDDGVILPQDTRDVVSQCLRIVTAYNHPAKPAYPVIRM
ncbi:methylcrotonoyl-CoA carboxylase beta chain, mitochondrial-like isoform X2 [Littorina saxatilis]|uniref:methylcrotonoyl-CoA carboxylase beta chain, mitochondrial-like isoform X2 n=1 Tax=Littorina saxatilis TaxID=31220 RepID=UPI0038B41DF8